MKKRNIHNKNKKAQAMVEAIIVFPLLILMIWGVWHLHTLALFKARAAMATRHSAWINSTKEDASGLAEQALFDVFYDQEGTSQNPIDQIDMGFTIASHEFFMIAERPPNAIAGFAFDLAGSASDALGGVGDLLEPFITALKNVFPFTSNTTVKIDFNVISPLSRYYENEDSLKVDRTYEQLSYFPVRWQRFYYHNSWDFFPGGIGQEDISSAIGGASDGLSDANDAMNENDMPDDDVFEYGGNVYTFDDYEEAMEDWEYWLSKQN